ncbi:branched-chain amino acid ABC transporter permease [Lichenicoccus sp.]|uniref:branched-chain amino acid ABC transporter permease n=1 Tax=Lichenicoccus sp. TaxID=2781899 RepID=UPI003D142169
MSPKRVAVRDYGGLALLGVLGWVLLVSVNSFWSSVLASILIWTVATSGLNLIAGLGGYPSLVQGAFYGLGAYGSAIALNAGLPLWLAALIAVGAAGVSGLAIGVIFARTRGQYFAIGTLFFGVITALVLNNWAGLTGGPLGTSVLFAFGSNAWLNAAIPACAAASLMLVRFVSRSRLGRRLVTVREDEDLAEHVGVPTGRTKLIGFVLSACVAGLAGVLIAQYNSTLSPDMFGYSVGFVMFVALSVGGAGRVLGPLLGSLFIVGVPDLLNLPSGIGLLLVGVVFIAVVILVPGGLMSGLDAVARLRRA